MTPRRRPTVEPPYWDGFPASEEIRAWRGGPPAASLFGCPAKRDDHTGAAPCPRCGTPPSDLEWFWFESPQETWEALCGRAGFISFCPTDELPVQFFVSIIN